MGREQIIRKVLGPFYVAGRSYHSPLPSELAEWYCYTSDAGHSILVVLSSDYRAGADLTGSLVPAPVKAVLRRYSVQGDYIVCDLPYSQSMGLQTDLSDDER